MSKKQKQKNPVAAAKPRIEIPSKPNYRNYYIIAILLLTGLCYSGIKNNQFTNWDDEEYVVENPLVKSTSNNNIKKIFDTETEVSLNYHPLTVYSLALNYKYSKLSPKAYYITNLIIHL